MNTLRLLVVDDHELVRIGVRAVLESQSGWIVSGEGRNGREAVQKSMTLRPDVVVLDLRMPVLNGLEAARQILSNNPAQRILILSELESERVMQDVLRAGVKAFILKSDPGSDLIAAVQALQRSSTFFTAHMEEIILRGYLDQVQYTAGNKHIVKVLTPREREILQLLAEGKSSKEVACLLDLSVKTAETHRNNIMNKLDAHSVAQLVLHAIQREVIYVSNTDKWLERKVEPDTQLERKNQSQAPSRAAVVGTSSCLSGSENRSKAGQVILHSRPSLSANSNDSRGPHVPAG